MTPRDIKQALVIIYSSTKDDYGIPQTTVSSTRNIDILMYLYEQRLVLDPRYNEVEYVGLTKDTDILTENVIKVNNIKYLIIHIIPTHRWTNLLLREMK